AATVAPIPGGARATIADGGYDSVMAWLADLSVTSSLRIKRVDLQKAAAPVLWTHSTPVSVTRSSTPFRRAKP
ncbi:hypothetical protein, partial [Stenotrophomonas maltophilia]|uniref:hypothetical protein n=1 Tax=Stenotrophomonas maltophilia TaxID=40324 RepID=UPI0019539A6F